MASVFSLIFPALSGLKLIPLDNNIYLKLYALAKCGFKSELLIPKAYAMESL